MRYPVTRRRLERAQQRDLRTQALDSLAAVRHQVPTGQVGEIRIARLALFAKHHTLFVHQENPAIGNGRGNRPAPKHLEAHFGRKTTLDPRAADPPGFFNRPFGVPAVDLPEAGTVVEPGARGQHDRFDAAAIAHDLDRSQPKIRVRYDRRPDYRRARVSRGRQRSDGENTDQRHPQPR